MKTRVRYFALFREQAGCDSESVNWTGGTAAELFQFRASNHPLLRSQAAALGAINDEMSAWETTVNEDDEVLFFPPVAGG
jgi:molybdopterin converting factor small subunit